MTIKDVAARSGFSAPTLRYYEEIGLLPESVRTPAGYRIYDDHTLARLAFINRAKQLGCSLDEIGGLTTAWDGGRCGPMQEQLRQLVRQKLTSAQDQIVELIALSSDLQQAAAALEQHRPDGPCDDTCGCITAGNSTPAPTLVRLSAKPDHAEVPIACSLGADDLHNRIDEWTTLLAHATRRIPSSDGVRVELDDKAPLDELARLVAAEQSCCRFFRFAITIDERGTALEIAGPDDAKPIIDSLFGTAT